MLLFSQRDSRWSNHNLGNAPSIGLYGCYVTDLAMIANDSGHSCNPATLDEQFTANHLYMNGDLCTDNMLDRLFPGNYQSTAYAGYRGDLISAAVPSSNTYAIGWISTASVPSHFVIFASANGNLIIDPWTGKYGTLAGYGGSAAIKKTVIVKNVFKPVPTPLPQPAPAPQPPIPPPTPKPQPPPEPQPDYSLQGLLIYLLNFWLALMRKR